MAKYYLYSDNDTGTFADPLKAIAVAEVSRSTLLAVGRDASRIIIEDKGDYYQIELPSELDQETIEQIPHPFIVGRGLPLASKKQQEKAEKEGRALDGFPYDMEQERRSEYFVRLNKLSQADRAGFNKNPNAEEFADLYRLTPHKDLSLYIYVNHFKIADGYNTLLQQWHGETLEDFRANLALFLRIFSTYPNNVAGAATKAEKGVTLLQLVNPASGKGGNAPKANGLSIGNLDGFWLIEYLKFVGLFTITAPLLIADSKDRKTYVLHPTKIELGMLQTVMEQFRATLYTNSATKLDILAALRFTQTLVRRMRDALGAPPEVNDFLALFGQMPTVTAIAQGFDVAFYKDMGSAYATMNLATINLPDWLRPIETISDAAAVLGLIEEHIRVVTNIKTAKGDEGSEELELLRRYRDFLSGHDSLRFFDFAARYGDYYLAKRHRAPNQFVSQFTTDGMETLMAQTPGKEPFTPILENEGFREIAAAIRQATVIAQYRAAREPGYPFEVRYGLGQELLRAANYPEDFLAALSDFIQSYNAENARIDERIAKGSLHSSRRASVRTDHINEIVKLIDTYNTKIGNAPEVICKMLVAYGYARDPRTPAEPGTAEPVAAMTHAE